MPGIIPGSMPGIPPATPGMPAIMAACMAGGGGQGQGREEGEEHRMARTACLYAGFITAVPHRLQSAAAGGHGRGGRGGRGHAAGGCVPARGPLPPPLGRRPVPGIAPTRRRSTSYASCTSSTSILRALLGLALAPLGRFCRRRRAAFLAHVCLSQPLIQP